MWEKIVLTLLFRLWKYLLINNTELYVIQTWVIGHRLESIMEPKYRKSLHTVTPISGVPWVRTLQKRHLIGLLGPDNMPRGTFLGMSRPLHAPLKLPLKIISSPQNVLQLLLRGPTGVFHMRSTSHRLQPHASACSSAGLLVSAVSILSTVPPLF